MAESSTNALVRNAIQAIDYQNKGYPKKSNVRENGIVWYKQDSYKNKTNGDRTIEKLLSTASKAGTGNSGRPEFLISTPKFYIVFEDKDLSGNHYHSYYPNIKEYIGRGPVGEPYCYAIDDVLRYAKYLNSEKDVIAIACSCNGDEATFRSTTYYLPKKGEWKDLFLMNDGGYEVTLMSIQEYQDKIDELNGIKEETFEEIYEELREYVSQSADFMEKMGVDAAQELQLVSFITLALSNKNSRLYKSVKKSYEENWENPSEIMTSDVIEALLGDPKHADTIGIISHRDLPVNKYTMIQQQVENTFNDTHLTEKDLQFIKSPGDDESHQEPTIMDRWDKDKNGKKKKNNYFYNGYSNILSRLVCSLYEYVILKYDRYKDKGIDVMGTFYSLLSQFYKADAKRGVVLTPTHITDLFCDLAEHFWGKSLDENTKILDICTGSGGFLISALKRINENIDNNNSLSQEDKAFRKEKARRNSLIGNEVSPKMYVLAYVNMLFHKDGSSQLCLHDGLRLERVPEFEDIFDIDESDFDSNNDPYLTNGADIGMINPPYDSSQYDQLQFIEAMLRYLKKGGIGIAIVPVTNQGASKSKEKDEILKEHTLLASILMPKDLFWGPCNSGASVGTCILIFKAHFPNTVKEAGSEDEKTHYSYLADWREDGFKIVNKRGRFEDHNKWKDPVSGYRKMYLDDLKKATSEFNREYTSKMDEAYQTAFGCKNTDFSVYYIPSDRFNLDIHDNGIKSTMVQIHSYPKIKDIPQFWSQNGKYEDGTPYCKDDPKYKYKSIKVQKTDEDGKPIFGKNGKPKTKTVKKKVLDKKGNPVQETKQETVFKNEDWNVLHYVKTNFNELSNDDFIKVIRDYKLFKYMANNNMFFSNDES